MQSIINYSVSKNRDLTSINSNKILSEYNRECF